MNPREFFLVENRYIDSSNQDEWLLNNRMVANNAHGGIVVYHIDENYIEYNYSGEYFNHVEWDPDGDVYDDTISHPGIVFEQRFLTPPSSVGDGRYIYSQYKDALYTTDQNTGTSGCNFSVFSPKFNSIKHIDPSCGAVDDTTSNSYNGLQDTQVVVAAMDLSGPSISVYLRSVIASNTIFIRPRER
jgi:hypothetical protein